MDSTYWHLRLALARFLFFFFFFFFFFQPQLLTFLPWTVHPYTVHGCWCWWCRHIACLDPTYWRLRLALARFLFFFFFSFFFFSTAVIDISPMNSTPVYCSRDPQISLFSNFFIKNGSHGTIHIFKNYFATVFSVFSFSKISSIQTDLRVQCKNVGFHVLGLKTQHLKFLPNAKY